jgi:hypothetical protein
MKKIVSSLVCLGLSVTAFGQDNQGAGANSGEYVDRVIAPDQLPALNEDTEDAVFDASGLPRGWQLEFGAGITSNNDVMRHEAGISASGYFETADYGAWSFDVDANRNGDGQNVVGRLSVFQRGMVLDHGWRVDNSLGTLSAPMAPMLRQQYRFALPAPAFLGISSEIRNNDGRIFSAAAGRSGRRTAGRFSNFDTNGGFLATIGGQTEDGPFQAAGTVITSEDDNGKSQVSAMAAMAWAFGTNSVQTNVLVDNQNASGIWIDGISKPDRIEHRYGLFKFDPFLQWAGQDMQSDVQGFYYRAGSRQSRWVWSGGVDHVESVSAALPSINYFTGQGRYQATSRWGFGGAASARMVSGGASSSLQAFLDQKTSTGTSRLQIEQARSKELRSEQITWDQSFANVDSFQWAAKLGFLQQHDRHDRAGHEWSASVYGSRDFGSRLRWDGMLKYAAGIGELAQSGVEANIGLNWTISPSWSLSATYYQNMGRRDSVFNLDPLLVLDEIDENDRSFFFALRYEYRAGRAVGVIGGAPGAGAGNIVGEIYLDANADGQRNADETPAADIVVLLDGRYSVRTDASGRFSFDRVAAGTHSIAAVSDNLPLPWQLPSESKTIEVKVRDTLRISLGALQPTK